MSLWGRVTAWIRRHLPDSHNRIKDLPSWDFAAGFGDPERWRTVESPILGTVTFYTPPEQEEAKQE